MFARNLLRTANCVLFKSKNVFPTLALGKYFSSQPNPHTARRPHHHSQQQQQQEVNLESNKTALNDNVKTIDMVLRYNSVSLEIEFEKTKKIYFINDNFTFNVLKEMIEFEYPSSNVEFDFSRSGSKLIEAESNIFNFLSSNESGEIIVEIDEQQYVLRNGGHSVLNQYLSQVEKESKESQGALHWFLQCSNNKIHPSHAGVLSHLITQFQQELKKLNAAGKRNINLSESELDNIFIKTFKSFSTPVQEEIETIQHQKNIIDQELSKLYERRDKLYESATKRTYLYLRLLLLISLGHIAAFYYMIFHVEWLGWDIIEPITYTVAQISVLLAIRFFWKHKQVRSVESILDLGRQKYLQKRVIKDIYANIREQIRMRESEKEFLEKRINILVNKKTYNTIQLHDL